MKINYIISIKIYEKSIDLKCECQSVLSSYITQAFLNSSDLNESMENIPDDVMARLLERVSKHKEEHIKDPQLLAKVIHFYIKILFFKINFF